MRQHCSSICHSGVQNQDHVYTIMNHSDLSRVPWSRPKEAVCPRKEQNGSEVKNKHWTTHVWWEDRGGRRPSLYYVWSCEKAMLHDDSIMFSQRCQLLRHTSLQFGGCDVLMCMTSSIVLIFIRIHWFFFHWQVKYSYEIFSVGFIGLSWRYVREWLHLIHPAMQKKEKECRFPRRSHEDK